MVNAVNDRLLAVPDLAPATHFCHCLGTDGIKIVTELPA